jgi:hypothetical protein
MIYLDPCWVIGFIEGICIFVLGIAATRLWQLIRKRKSGGI